MTFEPRPIPTCGLELPAPLTDLLETLAEHNHDVWAQRRLSDGWQHGSERSDTHRTHPGLVPYRDLSEGEKEYDRATVLETLRAILALGYSILPPGTGRNQVPTP